MRSPLFLTLAAAALGSVILLMATTGLSAETEASSQGPVTQYVAEGVDWTAFEIHAPENGTSEGMIFYHKQTAPRTVYGGGALHQEDWDVEGGGMWYMDWQGEATVVRARGPGGDSHRVSTVNPEGFAAPNSSLVAAEYWEVEGDSDGTHVGYLSAMTSADNVTINVTASEGWIGNRTQGSDGADLHTARNFDRVRLHTKVSDAGPGVTLDARQRVEVQESMVAAMRLTPGHGKAGWRGPGGIGAHCSDLLDPGCDARHHTEVVGGPAGVYDFIVDRHVQTTGTSGNLEPWVLTGDIERPR